MSSLLHGDRASIRDRWDNPQGKILRQEIINFWNAQKSSGTIDFNTFISTSKSEFGPRNDNDGKIDLDGFIFITDFLTHDTPYIIKSATFRHGKFDGVIMRNVSFSDVVLNNSTFLNASIRDIEMTNDTIFNNVDVSFAHIVSLKGLNSNNMQLPLTFEKITYTHLCGTVRRKFISGTKPTFTRTYTYFEHVETENMNRSNQKIIKEYIDWFEHTWSTTMNLKRIVRWNGKIELGWNHGFVIFTLTSKNWSSFWILARCIFFFHFASAITIFFAKSHFKGIGSILGAWYYTIVTFTTLGYGDTYPLDWLGRLIAGIIAMVGYLSLALLIYLFTRKIDKTY
jgi:hypothetical protein